MPGVRSALKTPVPPADVAAAMPRRGFLKAAAALGAPLVLPASVLGRGGSVPPSERIAVGVIGVGGRGAGHADALMGMADVRLVAVCDAFRSKAESVCNRVNAHYGDAAGAEGAVCAAYQDFRELLARPDVDAVFIAAPENWHAAMSIAAMNQGKDVYCEKALSLTVAEGRAMCATVRRTGRIFQAGTQQRSDRNFRFACELARNGYLGRLHTVWVGVPGGRALPVLPLTPPPADLDYELWLGPAQAMPYRNGLASFNWYFVSDYCAGWIQSWGVHHVDIALWGAPALAATTLEVEGTATFPEEGTADTSVTWQTRLRAPEGIVLDFCSEDVAKHGHGCRFAGDKGWVHVVRGGIVAEPASLLGVTLTPGDVRLRRSDHHHADFLNGVRTRREPVATVESCHLATTATLIADIATRAGRRLTWDWEHERFLHDDPCNRLLSRALRTPWQV
jgi:predicted dehydrogenase